MKQSVNIQDQFLNQLRKDGTNVYGIFIKWISNKRPNKRV